VESDYLNDNRTPDYGVGAINYEVLDVPHSRFLGASWSNYEVTQKSLTITAKHQLNASWELRAVGGAQGFKSDLYGTARPTSIQGDGKWKRNLQRSSADETYMIGQLDLTGNFNTGSLKHTILIGGDVDQYHTETPAYNIFASQQTPEKVTAAYDSVNVFDLSLYPQRADIPKAVATSLTKRSVNRVGFYVQNFVTITEKLKVLAGVRYSYMETRSQAFTYKNGVAVLNEKQDPARYDDAFTPRFGIVYQPLKTMSLFASYANSFNLNTGNDINFKPLEPSMMDQYEVGVKNDFWNGLISVNLTGYQIVNSNQSQAVNPAPTAPLNPSAQELAGEVTSKGVELDIMTRSIKGFSFIAGYSYNQTKYTKSNIYEVGSRLRYNPAHTANFSTQYNVPSFSVLKGLNAGFTLFYVGDMMAGRSTRLTIPNDVFKLIPLPSFFQVDLSAGYTYNKTSIRVRMTNVTNVLGYYAHDDNSINPIAPRQLVTTLAYKL
jgi:iron complex outermembrane receptor protein